MSGAARLRERLADLNAIQLRIINRLLGRPGTELGAISPDEQVIVVAHELSPGLTVQLDREHVVGLVSEEGTRTAHAAILAHSLGIPAVMGAVGALARIPDGAMLLLDGQSGVIVVDPTREELEEAFVADAEAAYDRREQQLGAEVMRELERRVLLTVLDRKWREHLYEMDYLREGIGLRAMAQRDPLVEYQREGGDMFNQMMEAFMEEVVGFVFHLDVQVSERPAAEALGREGIFVWDGDFYATGLIERLGKAEVGGVLRLGLVHYNTADEVDRTLEALGRVLAAR